MDICNTEYSRVVLCKNEFNVKLIVKLKWKIEKYKYKWKRQPKKVVKPISSFGYKFISQIYSIILLNGIEFSTETLVCEIIES